MVFNLTALEGLAPNLWIFIAHLIAFTIVIIILIIFAWKPTKTFLDNRKKLMNKEIEEAKEKNQNADNLLQEIDQKIMDAKKQALELQELSEEKAHLYWQKAVAKTKNDVDQLKQRAQSDIDKMEIEFEKAKKEEITKIALMAAEELMQKSFDAKDNKKLVASVIDEIVKND